MYGFDTSGMNGRQQQDSAGQGFAELMQGLMEQGAGVGGVGINGAAGLNDTNGGNGGGGPGMLVANGSRAQGGEIDEMMKMWTVPSGFE